MESLYFDEIHKGGRDTKSMLIKTAIICACILLCFVFGIFMFTKFGQFAFLLLVGTIAGTVYLFKYISKEYEYIFTNGEIDIDVISGQMMRKRLCTIKPENISNIVKYTDEAFKRESQGAIKVMNLSSGIKEESYILTAQLNHTKTVIVISPTERLIEAWKPYLKKLDYMMRFNNM